MSTYTVKAVNGPSPWQSQNGPQAGQTFHEFRLSLDGVEKMVSLNQKPETPAPVVGQTLTLDLFPHPKFPELMRGKKVQVGVVANGVQTLGGGGDDVTRASIEKQVSLKVAGETASQGEDPLKVLERAQLFFDWLRS